MAVSTATIAAIRCYFVHPDFNPLITGGFWEQERNAHCYIKFHTNYDDEYRKILTTAHDRFVTTAHKL
jgi:hypothetical protein